MREVNMDDPPEPAPTDLRGRLLHAMRTAAAAAARHNAKREREPIDPMEAALDAVLSELGVDLGSRT
jgi:hypothetical protein